MIRLDRLQEIENKLDILNKEIKELHNQHSRLSDERTKIIQINCDHNFEWTGYCEDNFERDIIKYEEQCPNCGLKRWMKCSPSKDTFDADKRR